MYDDFDDSPHRATSRLAAAAAGIAGMLVVSGGLAVWHHTRVGHANRLAVKYGAAPSSRDATRADRCVGVMRDDYSHGGKALQSHLPPHTAALLFPKVCSLGVQRGLVRDDGTMTKESGHELTLAVIKGMGTSRFQTVWFNELAVNRYHLAKPGKVTRWERCVAMGYSGYDAARPETSLPARDRFFRAVRRACTVGVKRGLVPRSGAPTVKALSRLIVTALRETSP
jgi:hypothetical protein